MRKLLTLALIAGALGVATPVLASEIITISVVRTVDSAALVSKAKHDPLDGFAMPKYLTAQQEEDARLVAHEQMFGLNHTP